MSNAPFPMQPLFTLTTAIRDGTHGTHARVAKGVPLLSAKNITAGGQIAFDDTDDLIAEAEYSALTRTFRLEPNDVLLTIVGSLGRRAIYAGEHVTFQRSVAYIRPRQDRLFSRFLFHWMAHPFFAADLARRSNATAQAGLYLGELGQVLVPAPAISVQSRIAQILDTLDTAIQDTEAIIAKLKAVKQGLLHDLLTRGIDANGELRPAREDAPQLYKQSPLGWMPNSWSVCGMLDVAPNDRQAILTGPFGADLGQADFRSDGVPVLRIGNVQAGFIDWQDTQFVAESKANALEKYRVREGDLLFARQGATTGRNALADARADGALINYHIIRVATDHAKCRPEYLYATFNSAVAKARVDQDKGRGTREGINSAQIAALRFPLPPADEQTEAVRRMRCIDERIQTELTVEAKLRCQKQGLMDDLLTGRVRVTPLLEPAAA